MNRAQRRQAARQQRSGLRATRAPAPIPKPTSLVAYRADLMAQLDAKRAEVNEIRASAETHMQEAQAHVQEASAFVNARLPELYRLEGAINLLDEQIAAEEQPTTDTPSSDGAECATGDESA